MTEFVGERLGAFVLVERRSVGRLAEHWLALPVEPFEPERPAHISWLYSWNAENPDDHAVWVAQRHRLRRGAPDHLEVLEVGAHFERPWFANAHIDGVDLVQIVRAVRESEAALDAGAAVAITLEVGRSLARLPRRSAEQDIGWFLSPWDVRVTWQGDVLIVGWSANTGVRPGVLSNSPRWLSPEMAFGRPLDDRSDVFVLGTLLYELLAGRSAFRGDSDFETYTRVVEVDVEPIENLRPNLPDGTARLMYLMLAPDPLERPDVDAAVRSLMELAQQLAAPDARGLGAMVRALCAKRYARDAERREQWEALTLDSWHDALFGANET
jgi:hypothetical protein